MEINKPPKYFKQKLVYNVRVMYHMKDIRYDLQI